MKTFLDYNDCIIQSEFEPIEKCKDGDIVMHRNKVNMVTFYKDELDYNGVYIKTTKTVLDKYFLIELLKKINEIESETKELEFISYLF